jgi:acetoacetyl-CoA synthetase
MTLNQALCDKIRKTIRLNTTAFHVPKHILQVPEIPKTHNGKLTELAIGDILNNKTVRNTESLQNPDALKEFYMIAEKY